MKNLAAALTLFLPALAAAQPPAEKVAADTSKTTASGSTFVAPAGWTLSTRGPATVLEAPEAGSRIAIVEVDAKTAEDAIEQAWAAYGGRKPWPLFTTQPAPDRDGWSQVKTYVYDVPPNEKRGLSAGVRFANGRWTVVLYDMADDVGEKRASQVRLVFGELLPKGYARETFAGKKAHRLDAARLAELGRFVETSMKELGVPGVALGIVQDGKVVFADGFGVRTLGEPGKVGGDTKFMIASNTKALTTLMLGKLLDEGKLTWDTPATKLLPTFRLGDDATTRQVLVKQLICACTGLPRQDMEWFLEYESGSAEGVLRTLATMQPTSGFGELYQYSNPMAAAAGYIGGHVAFPDLELGHAYDEAMRTRVFAPLGMTATTFDFALAQTGDFAAPHGQDADGATRRAPMAPNYSVVPMRPTGGAWSNVRDMLRYVQMELAEGLLPDGSRYVAKETLLARRAPQVAVSKDVTYGMGLTVDGRYGVRVVYHGGDMPGFHSDMMWLPEHGVGAVVLTNGDPGWHLRNQFKRKLLEVLFDGKPEADAAVAAAAKSYFGSLAAARKLMAIPPDPAEVAKLATRYTNPSLGTLAVEREGETVRFDVGEWESDVATRRTPDGAVAFITVTPGLFGTELVAGTGPAGRTLTLRDAQHEYVFTEVKPAS